MEVQLVPLEAHFLTMILYQQQSFPMRQRTSKKEQYLNPTSSSMVSDDTLQIFVLVKKNACNQLFLLFFLCKKSNKSQWYTTEIPRSQPLAIENQLLVQEVSNNCYPCRNKEQYQLLQYQIASCTKNAGQENCSIASVTFPLPECWLLFNCENMKQFTVLQPQ